MPRQRVGGDHLRAGGPEGVAGCAANGPGAGGRAAPSDGPDALPPRCGRRPHPPGRPGCAQAGRGRLIRVRATRAHRPTGRGGSVHWPRQARPTATWPARGPALSGWGRADCPRSGPQPRCWPRSGRQWHGPRWRGRQRLVLGWRGWPRGVLGQRGPGRCGPGRCGWQLGGWAAGWRTGGPRRRRWCRGRPSHGPHCRRRTSWSNGADGATRDHPPHPWTPTRSPGPAWTGVGPALGGQADRGAAPDRRAVRGHGG